MKSYFPESQNDAGKQSAKETLKPKLHGYGHVEEPASSLAAYQKSLEETSKFVIEEPKPCVPVSVKKMTRTSADGKPRLNLHEEEGTSGSEQKVRHLVIQYAVLQTQSTDATIDLSCTAWPKVLYYLPITSVW